MTVNVNKIVSWYESNIGKLTYSMSGSRNGTDGTADCSGSMTQALYEAGCSKPAYLYSTVTLPGYLQSNGFTRIAQNQDWDAKTGDVVLWSDGTNMAESSGAGGHVMVMVDANNEISTDYSKQGVQGQAVQQYNYDQYYVWNTPAYVEVWRYMMLPNTVIVEPVPSAKSVDDVAKEVIQGKWGDGSARELALKKAGYDPVAVQAAVNSKLKAQPVNSRYYTVQNGDTLSDIGKKFGIKWEDIASLNNIQPPYIIKPNQKLKY